MCLRRKNASVLVVSPVPKGATARCRWKVECAEEQKRGMEKARGRDQERAGPGVGYDFREGDVSADWIGLIGYG